MSLAVTKSVQERPLSAIVQGEMDGMPFLTRDALTILAGDGASRKLVIGTVFGKRLFGTITTDATGNTGNGAIGALSLGDNAQVGDYVATCIAAAGNGGTFAVIAPDGRRLADATVAVAYASPHINFTIADGAADFVVGDAFTLTVPEGDNKAVAIDFTATDGSQLAAGVIAKTVTAADGVDANGVGIKAFAQYVAAELVWPTGATAGQKAAAEAQLQASHFMPVLVA